MRLFALQFGFDLIFGNGFEIGIVQYLLVVGACVGFVSKSFVYYGNTVVRGVYVFGSGVCFHDFFPGGKRIRETFQFYGGKT
jgi:hypothetical protein